MDLEAKLNAAKEDLKLAEKGGLVGNLSGDNLTPNSRKKLGNALPREPAKQKLSGHRGSITSVAFHLFLQFYAPLERTQRLKYGITKVASLNEP